MLGPRRSPQSTRPEAVGWSGSTNYKPVSWNSNGTVTSLLPLIPGATAGGAMAGSGLFSGADAANAIDSNGDIVGAADVGGVQKAFYLPAGGSGVVLPTLSPSSPSAYGMGVSDNGFVAGYSTASDGNIHAFVWSASGGMIDLGSSGQASYASAISANGNTVVGDINPPANEFGQQGQAVEWTRLGNSWTETLLCPRSLCNQLTAFAVNDSGVAVGSAYDYPEGSFPYPNTIAMAYTSPGQIVPIGQFGRRRG